MDGDLELMRSELVRKPFDRELRFEFADRLLNLERYTEALEQYLLLVDMMDTAEPLLGVARCQVGLHQEGEAVQAYEQARRLGDFTPVQELESLSRERGGARPLRAVEKESAEIIELRRPEREGVGFDDLTGMDDLKRTLRIQIIEPFLRPGLFQRFKKDPGGGVLLYGPPGCGKTMTARAVAGECSANFISIGVSDVLSMWRGASEENLASMFEKARANRPCVLFFDELDALAYSRSKAGSDGTRTLVNEFLAQLDGFGSDNRDVLILAATNMPWDVDPAVKRPGRLSKQIFVPPPDLRARAAMFEAKLNDVSIDRIDYSALASASEHFSGADIDGVIDAAKDLVIGDIIESGSDRRMQQQDLERSLESAAPTTMDWLRTARNLVKYAGADASYRDVEKFLRKVKFV
ncbi:MAG: ATP-binding protein [Gammaproteobacteria bacterium]|nr:ATP-binding protein [Rhodospirillaceae bacterium]MDE0363977.1 ATP-binding protein [Gammaproteobacteria bacterium]